MLQVSEDRPFRGPAQLVDGQLSYTDKSEGTVSSFSGVERVTKNGETVYVLRYSGGFVR